MTHSFRGSDGTRLSLHVDPGPRGGATFLFVNGLACPSLYWGPLLDAFRGHATLVTFDLKGHGRSDAARTSDGATIEGCAHDAALALDEAGTDRAVVFGFSMGCQVALELWRRRRERVAGYVLALGAFERPFATMLHGRLGALPKTLLDRTPAAAASLALKFGSCTLGFALGHKLAQRGSMVGLTTSHAQMAPFYKHLGELDPATWLGLARSASEHSAAELLPTIDAPTLVVTGRHDLFTPPAVGRTMAESIPGAELLEVSNATHTGLLDAPQPIVGATARFLARRGLAGA